MMEYTPAWQLFWNPAREQNAETSMQQRSSVVIEELVEVEDGANMVATGASEDNGNRDLKVMEAAEVDGTVHLDSGKGGSELACSGEDWAVQQGGTEPVSDASDKKNISGTVDVNRDAENHCAVGGYKKAWGDDDWVKVTNFKDVAEREEDIQLPLMQDARGSADWYDLNMGFGVDAGPEDVGPVMGDVSKGKGKVEANGPNQEVTHKKRMWTETRGVDGTRKIYERKKPRTAEISQGICIGEFTAGSKDESNSGNKAGAAEQPCRKK